VLPIKDKEETKMTNFTGIVMKSNTIPEGHPLVFSRKILKEIVEHGKFINKPLFASPTLLHHTNKARKYRVGYITDCWLDKRGNLHDFGELTTELPRSTGEPLGLSLDSILYDLTDRHMKTAAMLGKQMRVDSLYVQGVTLVYQRVAAFQCSNFFVLR